MIQGIQKQDIQSNIQKLFIIRIFLSFIFSTPIMVLFWQGHWLDMTRIMLLQSIFAIAMVLFEVPTGYFADRMTRKISLILSWLFMTLGYLIYWFSVNFFGFLIAELTLALWLSFLSGADSALLYETLLLLWREKEHTRLYWRNEFAMYVALAFSQMIWPFFISYFNYNELILLSVPFLFVALIVSFTLIEPQIHSTEKHTSSIEGLKRLFYEHFHPSGQLLFIIIYAGAIYGLMQSALWLYQPYFLYVNIPIEYFWVLFASFQIIAAYASKHAHNIENMIWKRDVFLLSGGLLTLSYMGMAFFTYMYWFVFIYLQQVIRGYQKPIIATKINELAPSKYRATLLSVQWLSGRAFYALFIPWIWVAIDSFWLVTGVWLIALSGFLLTCGIFLRKRS